MRHFSSKLVFSILYPSLFVIILWVIRIYETLEKVDLAYYGLYPRTTQGLIGIITAPLIHGDASHLASNTLPLLILGSVMFYFYRPIAFQVFGWIYIITGIWVWVAARQAYHIGASGLVYGFVTFVFFSGVFRKDVKLLSISLFVAFLYGGTAYGILPITKGISWESHLMGSLAGLITAYHFRKEGPQAKQYDFGDDDENETIDVTGFEDEEKPILSPPPEKSVVITYNFIPKEIEEDK